MPKRAPLKDANVEGAMIWKRHDVAGRCCPDGYELTWDELDAGRDDPFCNRSWLLTTSMIILPAIPPLQHHNIVRMRCNRSFSFPHEKGCISGPIRMCTFLEQSPKGQSR